jgi:hypothetical protein
MPFSQSHAKASRLKALQQRSGDAGITMEIRAIGPALCGRAFTPDALARISTKSIAAEAAPTESGRMAVRASMVFLALLLRR